MSDERWEYKTVETGRKSGTTHKDVWPDGDGWEIDITSGRVGTLNAGWDRFDHHEELYFRRLVPAKVEEREAVGGMSMIDKVAKAIAEKLAPALSGGKPVITRDVAITAIEAMRRPTEAMLAAGSFAIEGLTEEDAKRLGEEEHFQSGAWQAEKVLGAMIDAALKED